MKSEDIVQIIKSPAFTIFAATICIAFLMNKIPVMMTTIKGIRNSD